MRVKEGNVASDHYEKAIVLGCLYYSYSSGIVLA